MKKYVGLLSAILVITVFTGVFFLQLFYPEPQLFIQPEYGRSDISHFNIPVRYMYSEALKGGQLPFWEKTIGTGFPILAESQMGAFLFPNYLLYNTLPFWLAFNLSYVLAFFFIGTGMYLFIREITKNGCIGLIAGLSFAFSGYFIGHTSHINMLQTAAFVPWMFWMYERWSKSHAWGWLFGMIILASQQILGGHMQTSFITGLMLMAYASRELVDKQYKKVFRQYMFVITIFILGFVLSAIQILPTLELHQLSIRSEPYTVDSVTYFSMKPDSLLTMLHPYIMGNILDGTYKYLPGFSNHGNIFWETQAYIGIVMFVAFIGSLLFLKKKNVKFLWITIGLAALLMFAKYSPLYFIYAIPPFSYFTTPARFLMAFLFFVTVVGAYTLQYFMTKVPTSKHKGLYILLVSGVIANILYVWYGYGVRTSIDSYMNPPEVAQFILDDDAFENYDKRTMNFDSGMWLRNFLDSGWTSELGYETYFNEVSPNMNALWQLPHHKAYLGRIWTQRKVIHDRPLNTILFTYEDPVSPLLAERLIGISGIKYLVSLSILDHIKSFEKIYTSDATLYDGHHYVVYRNNNSVPRFRLTDKVFVARTLNDYHQGLVSDEYDLENAYVESDVWKDTSPETYLESSVSVITDSDLHIELQTSSNKEAFLVIADLYFPGWDVQIDGKPVEYFPTNIIQRGIIVPAGEHTISMKYEPTQYQLGKNITIAGYSIVLLGLLLSLWRARQSS